MLEMWLSKERLLLNSTPRFLTDDEESREQPSSVRQCSRLLLLWFLGPIINTYVFSEFSSKKLFVIQSFISTMHSISFSIWCVSPGREEITLQEVSLSKSTIKRRLHKSKYRGFPTRCKQGQMRLAKK